MDQDRDQINGSLYMASGNSAGTAHHVVYVRPDQANEKCMVLMTEKRFRRWSRCGRLLVGVELHCRRPGRHLYVTSTAMPSRKARWNMRGDYVSDFEVFMNRFLEEHPEVIKDQKYGWNIFWDHKVDFESLQEATEGAVPDDSYGFYPADWRSASKSLPIA
jgi:hypothetical protein